VLPDDFVKKLTKKVTQLRKITVKYFLKASSGCAKDLGFLLKFQKYPKEKSPKCRKVAQSGHPALKQASS
jgi:hypothetical protein